MTTLNGPRAAWALTGDAWLPGVRLLRAELIKLTRRRRLMIAAAVLIAGAAIASAALPGAAGPGAVLPGAADSALVLAGAGGAVAALLGVVAGAADVAAGVFPSLVTTGRSRVALFLARVPAGLALSAAFMLAGYLVTLAGSALRAGHPAAAPGGLVAAVCAAFLLGLGAGSAGAGIWRRVSRDA
jgi:hypothetical protein